MVGAVALRTKLPRTCLAKLAHHQQGRCHRIKVPVILTDVLWCKYPGRGRMVLSRENVRLSQKDFDCDLLSDVLCFLKSVNRARINVLYSAKA